MNGRQLENIGNTYIKKRDKELFYGQIRALSLSLFILQNGNKPCALHYSNNYEDEKKLH